MKALRCFILLLLALPGTQALAFVVNGLFNDAGNLALVAPDLSAPSFVDDFAIANNVALHSFNVAAAATYTFDSDGFAAGGADPYFTLFAGTGNAGSVHASNYTQAFSTGGDFVIVLDLLPGDYTIAMGVFANLSVAENFGGGTLADGFTGLGGPNFLGSSFYELNVSAGDPPPPPTVPEPPTALLLATAALGAGLVMRQRRNRTGGRRPGVPLP